MPAHRGHLLHLPPNRVWRTYPGGRTLDELAGAPSPADTHFAEDWIASTTKAVNPPEANHEKAGRVIPSAPHSGRPHAETHGSLGIGRPASATSAGISSVRIGVSPALHNFADLLAADPDYFLGPDHAKRYGPQPQLLVKFLDSGTRLHFQVHPTRDFAQRILGAPSGKTEAYHVLAVRGHGEGPEAIGDGTTPSRARAPTPSPLAPRPSPVADAESVGYIYVGFQRPPSPSDLRAWILTQNLAAIEACFDKIPVRPGDTFIIPGGTPHALGAGVFMVEIQEPSDLVIRFEFERAGFVLPESSRFMNRDIDFALTVFNFAPLPLAELDRRVRCHPRRIRTFDARSHQDELIGPAQTDCFRVLKTHLGGPIVKDENAATIAIVTAGSVIAEVGGERHTLRTYDKVFLPARLGPVRFTPEGSAEILECLPPR